MIADVPPQHVRPAFDIAALKATIVAGGGRVTVTGPRVAEVAPSSVPNDPAISFHDVQIAVGERTVQVPVTLSEPTNHTITLQWQAQNGTGTWTAHYVAASGWLVFQPGESRKLIPITMLRDLGPGQTVRVVLTRTPNHPPVRQVKGTSTITGGAASPARTGPADAVPLPAKPAGQTMTWMQDFADPGFCVTDSGRGPAGKSCWQGRPAHGLTQPSNKELGLYASPDRFPNVTMTALDSYGKRFIQLERHPEGFKTAGQPITYDYGGGPKPFVYSSAMLQGSKLPIVIQSGSYVEARLRVDLVEGAWPAFWLLSANGTWPPEIDMLEGFWRGERVKPDLLTMSVHWKRAAGGGGQYGTDVPLGLSVPNFDVRNWHVYGVHIEESWLTYYVDDVPVWRAPHEFRRETRWYPLFDVTTGGIVGEPAADARLPVRMGLDWIKVWN